VRAKLSLGVVAVALFGVAVASLSGQQSPQRPRLVGYFPQWALYNDSPYLAKELVTSGSARLVDQINYAQGFVANGRGSIADPNTDLNTSFTAKQSIDGRADSGMMF
jgi:chitinase